MLEFPSEATIPFISRGKMKHNLPRHALVVSRGMFVGETNLPATWHRSLLKLSTDRLGAMDGYGFYHVLSIFLRKKEGTSWGPILGDQNVQLIVYFWSLADRIRSP